MRYGLFNWLSGFDRIYDLTWMQTISRIGLLKHQLERDYPIFNEHDESGEGCYIEGCAWLEDFRDSQFSPSSFPESEDNDADEESNWDEVFQSMRDYGIAINEKGGFLEQPLVVFSGSYGLFKGQEKFAEIDDNDIIIEKGHEWVIILDKQFNQAVRNKARELHPDLYSEYLSERYKRTFD